MKRFYFKFCCSRNVYFEQPAAKCAVDCNRQKANRWIYYYFTNGLDAERSWKMADILCLFVED